MKRAIATRFIDMPRKGFALLAGVVVVGALVLSMSAVQTRDAAELSAEDKAEVIEVFRLQAVLGDQVWPGLAKARIPIIIYNDTFEFLVGEADPPAPWEAVEGDACAGQAYFRRRAADSQAFAVPVGPRWAGSLSTLARMNQRSPFKLTRDFHVVLVLHEIFHAFQAGRSPQRFKQAGRVYAVEARYPAGEPEFSSGWDREGMLLALALKATDAADVRSRAAQFLQARDDRRRRSGLPPDLLAFERELEWLEGLAKYVEVRFYELAAAHKEDAAYSSYRSGLPYWGWDFARLERQLGRQAGDMRFYLSGMAQARLLDGLSPEWKAEAMSSGVYLEDLLRASLRMKTK